MLKTKIFAVICLTLTLTLTLSACAPAQPTAPAPSPAVAISAITVAGEVGAEPQVSVPADIQAADGECVQLREGTGEQLTTADEVSFKLQKIALDDTSNVVSSWNEKDSEMSIDLTDAYKEQTPAALRELLLNAKVGAVIAYKTTVPRAEFNDIATNDATGSAMSDAEIDALFSEEPTAVSEDLPQIWIITVTAREKAVAPTKIPNNKQ